MKYLIGIKISIGQEEGEEEASVRGRAEELVKAVLKLGEDILFDKFTNEEFKIEEVGVIAKRED